MRAKHRTVLGFMAVTLVAAAAFGADAAFSADDRASATIVTASGRHEISVEVADDPRSREIGLMNRNEMARDHGMLFDFEETRPVTMWMKNTYIPLDMLFLDESGEVTRVKSNARPLSLDLIPSGGPVRYVLELNGGAAKHYGVKPGDHLEHPDIPAR